MADPIVPQTPNVDGQVITIWTTYTANGAGVRVTTSLPTYAPKIDTRIGHPVLSMIAISNQAGGAVDDREVYTASNEMARGTSADSAGEWDIVDVDTVGHTVAADFDGVLGITYIAFGAQRA
jgi:hypothetical protein